MTSWLRLDSSCRPRRRGGGAGTTVEPRSATVSSVQASRFCRSRMRWSTADTPASARSMLRTTRTAPHPRALADDQGARGRDRSARRPDRAAAAFRARLRAADRRQARRRDRRRGQVRQRRQARARRRRRSDPRQLWQDQPPPPSTAAPTARSTRPSTASPSPACAATQRPRTRSPANAPKARAPKKPLPQTWWICLIFSVSQASVRARSDGGRRSQSWKLVRFTPSTRHITATG